MSSAVAVRVPRAGPERASACAAVVLTSAGSSFGGGTRPGGASLRPRWSAGQPQTRRPSTARRSRGCPAVREAQYDIVFLLREEHFPSRSGSCTIAKRSLPRSAARAIDSSSSGIIDSRAISARPIASHLLLAARCSPTAPGAPLLPGAGSSSRRSSSALSSAQEMLRVDAPVSRFSSTVKVLETVAPAFHPGTPAPGSRSASARSCRLPLNSIVTLRPRRSACSRLESPSSVVVLPAPFAPSGATIRPQDAGRHALEHEDHVVVR